MKIHCDSCGKGLGDSVHEAESNGAWTYGRFFHRLPDIICEDCRVEGYSISNPKYPLKVYGKEYESYPPKVGTRVISPKYNQKLK